MLLLMVIVGLIATFMAGASRGSTISLGMTVSLLALTLPFLLFGCVYWLGVAVAGSVSPLPTSEITTAPQKGLDSSFVNADVAETAVVESSTVVELSTVLESPEE